MEMFYILVGYDAGAVRSLLGMTTWFSAGSERTAALQQPNTNSKQ